MILFQMVGIKGGRRKELLRHMDGTVQGNIFGHGTGERAWNSIYSALPVPRISLWRLVSAFHLSGVGLEASHIL